MSNFRASGDDTPLKRPSRNPKPTATFLKHSEGAALPSQQRKVNEYRAAEAAKRAEKIKNPEPEISPTPALSRSSSTYIEIPSSPPASSDIALASTKRKVPRLGTPTTVMYYPNEHTS